MEEVHEVKGGALSVEEWAGALSLDAAQVDPEGYDGDTIRGAIASRTEMMKAELEGYVRGQRDRMDM